MASYLAERVDLGHEVEMLLLCGIPLDQVVHQSTWVTKNTRSQRGRVASAFAGPPLRTFTRAPNNQHAKLDQVPLGRMG